jgi:hypothetical protein
MKKERYVSPDACWDAAEVYSPLLTGSAVDTSEATSLETFEDNGDYVSW